MTKKILQSLLVLGLLGTLAGVGTFAAFSSTTENPGNSFTAGTVDIGDNDAGSFMYNVSGQRPGTSVVRCIKVTYTGTLDADVRLYTTSSMNAGAQYMDLTVEEGISDATVFPNCGTFVAESTVYSGTLANFGGTRNSYANGAVTYPGVATKWVANDSLVYRFTVSLQDVNAAQGATSGTHGFTWEARSQ